MADAPAIDDAALVALFYALRADGYRLTPQQLAQARLVLTAARAAGTPAADLPFLLTPLFAKTPRQQAEVQALLRAKLAPDTPLPPAEADLPTPPTPTPLPDVGGRATPFVVAAILFLVAIWLVNYLRSSPDPAIDDTPLPQPTITLAPLTETITELDPAYAAWLWTLGIAPAVLLIGWWLLHRHRRRAGLGRDTDEAGLDRLDLGARPIATPLFAGPGLAPVARQWRLFRRVPTADLDAERTVAATIAAGGLFTPVRATRPLAPEYLVLIEEMGRHDHLARLADNMADRLADEGVAIRRYYLEDGVTQLRAHEAEGGGFVDLAELPAGDRQTLVLIGTGAALVDRLTGVPTSAHAEFARWERRVLLSTRPVADWDDREDALLRAGFALGTAEESGVAALGRHVARGFPAQHGLLEARLVAAD